MKMVNEIGLNRLFNKHTENGYVIEISFLNPIDFLFRI